MLILYSTSLHKWEVWQAGQPIAFGSLEAYIRHFPEAMEVSERQLALAEMDKNR